MNETRKKILDEAQDLMQTRGYAEMTFQEIATRVGIKKPSIVHHFPSKAELAAVVLDRYHRQFIRAMQDIAKDPSQGAWDCLEFYFNPYRHFAKTDSLVCLSGALLGEFQILPVDLQKLCKSSTVGIRIGYLNFLDRAVIHDNFTSRKSLDSWLDKFSARCKVLYLFIEHQKKPITWKK